MFNVLHSLWLYCIFFHISYRDRIKGLISRVRCTFLIFSVLANFSSNIFGTVENIIEILNCKKIMKSFLKMFSSRDMPSFGVLVGNDSLAWNISEKILILNISENQLHLPWLSLLKQRHKSKRFNKYLSLSPIHMKLFPFEMKNMSEKYRIWFILNSQSKFQPPNPSIIAS